MSYRTRSKFLAILALTVLLSGIFTFGTQNIQITSASYERPDQITSKGLNQEETSPDIDVKIFLPTVYSLPWVSPFGYESNIPVQPGSTLLTRVTDLKPDWARMNNRISWRVLQPNEGDPIQWESLKEVESELRALRSAGVTPVMIVDDYPRWATIAPTSCGAIKAEKFEAFAQFMSQIVAHFKVSDFNVRNWEMGNEPDVDPSAVPVDSVFGCWGDDQDEFYGGRHYGEMLKVVSPAIKAADPLAKVWIGGLLLSRPKSSDSPVGRPELFFQEILETGAAPYFDVVPYHWYPSYLQKTIDYDNAAGTYWDALGGGVVGKAAFLRDLMSQYGVDKPLFINETGLGCPDTWQSCQPPSEGFYQMQADTIVRFFTRGFSANLMGFIWYTLNGPGWRSTGLLNGNHEPKPVYIAYQQLISQLHNTSYVGPFDYGSDLEAYAFQRGGKQVHVIWAKTDQTLRVSIPADKFTEAHTRDGATITPAQAGSDKQLDVGFSPIYILRQP